MGRRTLSNAQYREPAQSRVPRYRAFLVEQKSRAAMRVRLEAFRPALDRVIDFMELNDPRASSARRAAQDEYNRHRAALLAAMTTTGRVHIGKWTIRWYSLRRWAVRIWRRFHVA